MPEAVPQILPMVVTIPASDLVRLPFGHHLVCDGTIDLYRTEGPLLGPCEPSGLRSRTVEPVVNTVVKPCTRGPRLDQFTQSRHGMSLMEEPLPLHGGVLEWLPEAVGVLVQPTTPVARNVELTEPLLSCRDEVRVPISTNLPEPGLLQSKPSSGKGPPAY